MNATRNITLKVTGQQTKTPSTKITCFAWEWHLALRKSDARLDILQEEKIWNFLSVFRNHVRCFSLIHWGKYLGCPFDALGKYTRHLINAYQTSKNSEGDKATSAA